MKRILFSFAYASFGLSACFLTCCTGKSDKQLLCADVLISQFTDSTLTAAVGGDVLCFDTREAQLTNGAFIAGDSAKIYYTNGINGAKAYVITVKSLPPTVVEAVYDPSKELLTTSDTVE